MLEMWAENVVEFGSQRGPKQGRVKLDYRKGLHAYAVQ